MHSRGSQPVGTRDRERRGTAAIVQTAAIIWLKSIHNNPIKHCCCNYHGWAEIPVVNPLITCTHYLLANWVTISSSNTPCRFCCWPLGVSYTISLLFINLFPKENSLFKALRNFRELRSRWRRRNKRSMMISKFMHINSLGHVTHLDWHTVESLWFLIIK